MSPQQPRLPSSVFEALFIKSMGGGPELRAQLLPLGVDLNRLAPEYAALTMYECVQAAAKFAYADLPPNEAQRQLGRRFTQGFKETLVGSVVIAGLGLLGPERLIGRLPRLWTVGQSFGKCLATRIGERHWQWEYSHPEYPDLPVNASFNAGAIEQALLWTKVTPVVKITKDGGPGYALDLTW